MRIHIESGGLTDANDMCRTANQIAAAVCDSLASKLSGFAGMAGDDSTSVEFASTYDSGAREALATLRELTHAFIGLGRLLGSTSANHRGAEEASASVTGFSPASSNDDDFVRVSPPTPPSSLGANPPQLGVVETFILDQVEGFVWPGADVVLLLDAASIWRRTAESVADLDAYCDLVITFLERQVSPEIPLAIAALDELRGLIRDTADQLTALATSCEEYADAVRATHQRTLDLLAEIGRMVVEGAAISLIVGGLTGGLGAGAAGTAAIARIAAQAPRFHALLTTLRITSAATSSRLRTAREGLGVARARFETFVRVRVRSERGEIQLPGGGGRKMKFPDKQVQKKFKHAPAFGVRGPYTPASARRFESVVQEFVDSDGVVSKVGTMRGQPGEVVFHYAEVTRQCVATTKDGDFVSGWVLNPRQLAGVMEKGHLGGG